MIDARYRENILKCVERYTGMIRAAVLEHNDLTDFLDEVKDCAATLPLFKLNRWLGYIQGVLIERGLTTVEAERDWTRPLFRPLDFPEPGFCGWKWSTDDLDRMRLAAHAREGDSAVMATAAEAIRIWCERGMPGLNEVGCPAAK